MSNSPRRRFAIINGDDFGFSSEVNQAIIRAYEQGVLTSASLMVTGDAAEEAIALARSHPDLAVGLHLVLVCGKSALPPFQIPNLVDSLGNFSNNPLQAGLLYQFHLAAYEELRREIRAQLKKFRNLDLPLSHVDGHLHLHTHPVVLRILVELAREFDIKVIRLPSEELEIFWKLDRSNLLNKLVWTGVFGGLRHYGEGLLRANGISFAERVYGLLQTGSITEEYLLGLIPQIQADVVEIYAHPAVKTGEAELAALLSEQVREALNVNGFELTNYHHLTLI
ncbi:MAG: hopanoid biosynthesis-associated protein HpnK [Goleter apudmare HA4340-LM2]|nr:hopanoid biosynthesis-associated protein HpnK [Goleter apudmare HA4340-LM2]